MDSRNKVSCEANTTSRTKKINSTPVIKINTDLINAKLNSKTARKIIKAVLETLHNA